MFDGVLWLDMEVGRDFGNRVVREMDVEVFFWFVRLFD